MTGTQPEQFADYDSYFHSDTWPSVGGGETWVGDMPPQHCAASIYKLRRWALSQWSDEVKGEQEWAKVMETFLYRHLAARATAQDFVSAREPRVFNIIASPDANAMNMQQASVALLYALASAGVELQGTDDDSSRVGQICVDVITALYKRGYTLQKEQP